MLGRIHPPVSDGLVVTFFLLENCIITIVDPSFHLFID